MGSLETIAAIRTLSAQLAARVGNQEIAPLMQQIQRYVQEVDSESRIAIGQLELQLMEERTQLVKELKALLPQAGRERDEARARAKELEARVRELETKLKVLESKAAAAPRPEAKPLNVRVPVSSQDFEVR